MRDCIYLDLRNYGHLVDRVSRRPVGCSISRRRTTSDKQPLVHLSNWTSLRRRLGEQTAENERRRLGALGWADAVVVAAEPLFAYEQSMAEAALTESTDASGRTGHSRYKAYRTVMERL